jgi:diaminopimelate decarboxylase
MVLATSLEPPLTGHQYLPPMNEDIADASPNQSLMPLTACVNSQDHLEVGGCDVPDLVRQFGSPLYIVDEVSLRTACRQYQDALQAYYPGESLAIYASKAWNCLATCAITAQEGLGLDVVSGGELYTAIQAGVSPDRIYFHGNNKSLDELKFAIAVKCTLVVDSWAELRSLADMKVHHPIRIMLRLTPGIECHTHEYIRTGHLDSKFGFDPTDVGAVFAFVNQASHLHCIGLHAHIGSQIFELQPHHDLADVMVDLYAKALQAGLPITELDIGGGLGIRYVESDDPPSITDWVKTVATSLSTACQNRQIPLPKLIVEPGRSLIGTTCITAYTIGGQKQIPDIRTYVTIDGGMSDNPRPITYQAIYRAVVANRMSAPCNETVTIAGKHCESGDILIPNAQLPQTHAGDILVVLATGAYNYSMASNYNRIPRASAVLVHNGEANVILQRETYTDLIRQDVIPERIRVAQS